MIRLEDGGDLRHEATKFALDLTQTIQSVVPDAAPFRVTTGSNVLVTRLYVRQEPFEGISLSVDGQPLLRLMVDLLCTFDHRGSYLAVEQSQFKVLAVGSGDPLLRYEYIREPDSTQAGAHLQIHAHRDAFSHVMARCGASSPRARKRTKSADAGDRLPMLADLHLPLGGPRFRPCLEDILQMLIDELGVDAPTGALDALARGRIDWRRKQLAAAVRDSPETAARVLRELNYAVTPPEDLACDRLDRLSAL